MTLPVISQIITGTKNFIPALQALVNTLPAALGPVGADVQADVDAVLKTIADLQTAFEKLEASVKAANPPAAA